MKNYVILTDSCSDLPKELREKYGVEYLPMRILYGDKDIPADLDWGEISFEQFYALMRDGVRIKTSQVNASEYVAAFEKYAGEGLGVLSISCSSALSSSYKGSIVARDEVKAKFPDAEIICIDSRNSCAGLGQLCITASKLRAEGKTLAETAEYIEKNKQRMNQFCTVESLAYLKRAGRVSATSAVFGGLLQVKPIIISDVNGQNGAIEKVKGRKNSFERLVTLFAEAYEDDPYQQLVIAHADCYEDALTLKKMLEERLKEKAGEIEIRKIGLLSALPRVPVPWECTASVKKLPSAYDYRISAPEARTALFRVYKGHLQNFYAQGARRKFRRRIAEQVPVPCQPRQQNGTVRLRNLFSALRRKVGRASDARFV